MTATLFSFVKAEAAEKYHSRCEYQSYHLGGLRDVSFNRGSEKQPDKNYQEDPHSDGICHR